MEKEKKKDLKEPELIKHFVPTCRREQTKNLHSWNFSKNVLLIFHLIFNPFTDMMLFKNDQSKCEIWNHYAILSSFFLHGNVEGFSSKCTALKVDVIII